MAFQQRKPLRPHTSTVRRITKRLGTSNPSHLTFQSAWTTSGTYSPTQLSTTTSQAPKIEAKKKKQNKSTSNSFSSAATTGFLNLKPSQKPYHFFPTPLDYQWGEKKKQQTTTRTVSEKKKLKLYPNQIPTTCLSTLPETIWSKLGESITIPQNAATSVWKRWKALPNKFENSDGRLTDPPCPPHHLLLWPAPAALISRDTSGVGGRESNDNSFRILGAAGFRTPDGFGVRQPGQTCF